MLPLRLRGARGIRTRYVCSSCCANALQGTGAYGRGATATRTYATKKKNAAPPPAGESSKDVKATGAADDSAPVQPSKEDRQTPRKARSIKAKGNETPSGGRKKKVASSPKAASSSKASKDKTASVAGDPKKSDQTVQLWKETLDILNRLQETQGSIEGTQDAAAPKRKDGREDDPNKKRSLKSHFPPMKGAPSQATQRQAKLLEGTLEVLKSVLTVQAGQRTKASKAAKTPSASNSTTKPERKQTTSKGAKETGKKPVRKIPVTSLDPSVAQGFSALVQSAIAKKRAAGPEGASRGSKAGIGRAAPRSSKDENTEKPGELDWENAQKQKRNIKTIINKVDTSNMALEPVDVDTAPVPRVEYGLDRVLFNEGVYVLQDPRTRVFNFDPYLATIMPVNEFDFDALKQYVTSSKDTTLIRVAKKHNKKFTGSTSSMTATLAHFHYLLSRWRPINAERISKGYEPDSENFGAILRAPAATFLHYKDGTYAIDADKEHDSETILSMLGKSMEKLLTAPKEEFEKYRRSNSHQLTEEERNADESYHYTTFGDFMMRSQLDAYDPRLPGTGVFDLKTRAVVTIRMDARNHEKGLHYELRQRQGQWESFEREYYDMIRLAFLKYSLQVRMGRMDGIFVAYHNTQRIFGFQYIPLEEMDLSLHGTTDLKTGDLEFMTSLQLWEEMLKKATEKFPEKSLRIHVETRPSTVVPFMYFFAEPVDNDEIKAIQEHNKEESAKFQERVLGIKQKPDGAAEAAEAELDEAEEDPAAEVEATEDDAESTEKAVEEVREPEESIEEAEEDSEDVWEDMMDVVEQTMESDAQGISAIRDAIEDALEQSGLLHAKSSEEADQYVEALLAAIVDVDAERAKTGDEAVTEVPEGESETPGGQNQDQDGRLTDNLVSGDSSSQAAKPSRFGFLSSWFGSGGKEADTTTKQEPTSEREQDQDLSGSAEQDSASKDDATEAAATETKITDDRPDDSLRDLLVKLTSRIGSSSDALKATEELSEDQAKLRNFESILLEMMPKAQESAEAAEEDTTASDAGKTSEDIPPFFNKMRAPKPVLGLVLTIRNKVNDKYVTRPEKLTASDKWDVEYAMEEIPEEKVQDLYNAMKKRRQNAYSKDPSRDAFKSAFGGVLGKYNHLGRLFRQEETKLAKKQPLLVYGQDPESDKVAPFRPLTTPQDRVKKRWPRGNGPFALESKPAGPDAKGTVAGVTKKELASFREWREQDQQKQGKEKEKDNSP
ncbi:hypothetical protein Daus18300_012015 [Diaporthe australafricana]|uniref:Uncharacterized protein n=1 Tax=Diaporthe australafricana TaxID=127596 RepID=A0ABR3W496_9PEZI